MIHDTIKQVSIPIGEQEIVIEAGRMATQANGSVYASLDGTAVLATVCCSDSVNEDLDYVPLQVEYNEKYYAAGKIPGGFPRREGRPKDHEILVSRLTDRPMRPLFSKEFKRDIQVVPTVISADMINPPDVVAMIAASAAVTISDIPFDGPTGSIRIGYLDGSFIVNPSFDQIEKADLDIIVAGTSDGITMVEGGAMEVSEEQLLEAIDIGAKVIGDICSGINRLKSEIGKEKLPLADSEERFELRDEIWNSAYSSYEEACFVKGKHNRYAAIDAIKAQIASTYADRLEEDDLKKLGGLFEDMEYEIVRKSILERGIRTDGRKLDEIRPITCEIEVLPRAHGSALFTRGETQALAVTTLGTVSDEKLVDDIRGDKRYESFMLHYNFPPFSVGETGRLGTGRREIGHGHLAHRAIEAVLPTNESFPYTLRVVSEILESNGSSSMATVCGSSLALQNAGVPIRKPVAGIAMGLVSGTTNTSVLSDILGEEDHLGDMDFKVDGTEDGITAFQMDIKISGVSREIMQRALEQAKVGRKHILGVMADTISTPADDISQFAPKITSIRVEEDKIGLIIGPGGKTIKGISEKSGATINIDDDGKVLIYGKDTAAANSAAEMIQGLIAEPEVGTLYEGTVKRILDFGAFVEIMPGKEGLVHISRLARGRVENVTDVLSEGQEIPVKIIEIDRMGRINLSYIDAIDPDGASSSPPPRPRPNRQNRRGPRRD